MIKSIANNTKLHRLFYVLILVFTFFKIYSNTFDKKISLVGDNATYFILGKSIANGEGYKNIQHLNKESHYHYPPGYPLIIASTIKVFSDNILYIKMLNGILFLMSVLLLFFIIKNLTKNQHIAFAASFLTLFNYHLLVYSTSMMSEIPFLFFSFLCIFLFINVDFSKPVFKNYLFFLLLLCLSFSYYIRSIGLALLLSLCTIIFLKKHWHYLILLISSFTVLYLPWFFRNKPSNSNSYLQQLALKNPYQPELGTMSFTDTFERVLLNIERYITREIPSSILHIKVVDYTKPFATALEWCLGLFILICVVIGIYKLTRFRNFIIYYFLAFLALLMLWPSVWYGTRFILPIVPFLIFLFLFGLVKILKWLFLKVTSKHKHYFTPLILLFILIFWSFTYGHKSITKLHNQAKETHSKEYRNYFEIAEWINKNTPSNSITCVRKESLFYMFSKKYVTTYKKTLDREAQIEYLKTQNVDYVVVEQLGYSSTSKYLIPVIDRYPSKFKIIKTLKNPNTYLMQFLPHLGYSGAWENEKRNGLGTYLWEDGQKYNGYWKNDLRHGKGKLYLKNGDYLHGVWNEGKLNGEVIKKNKNDAIIEKSVYKNNIKVKTNNAGN